MRIERHPKLDILVREDGAVYLPKSGTHPAHWTFGRNNGRGYLQVGINGKNYRVHRLIAETFIPNPEGLREIDHINRNPSDNRVENLRWADRSQNTRNTRANDRVDSRGGTHSYEDKKQYHREHRQTHKQDYHMAMERYCKTHKNVRFSDGKKRWIPNEQAAELLKLPVNVRGYVKTATQRFGESGV